MFRGTYEHPIDDKGRINVPLKFRELDTTSLDGERIVTIDCRHIQNLRGSDGRAER